MTNWLDRTISQPAPHMCLCLCEAEYLEALKAWDMPPIDDWIATPQAGATAHKFTSKTGELVAVVCIDVPDGVTGIQIASLLTHEAVHIWQDYCLFIGEKEPGREQEAYAIQHISETLMNEYARRVV